MPKPYCIEEMTWEEVESFLENETIAIVPTGSSEQHGPHLPIGTDFMVSDKLAKEVGRRTEVLVSPTLPVGYAEYHTDFPGTLSLSAETLTDVYKEVCLNLIDYGVTHIVFVNSHGGNMATLNKVGNFLRKKNVPTAAVQWWDIAGGLKDEWKLVAHGGFIETSMVLAVEEDLVDMDKAEKTEPKKISDEIDLEGIVTCRYKKGLYHLALRTKDYTDTGYMVEYHMSPDADHDIPPTEASTELGEEIMEAVADNIADFVEEFKQVELEPVENKAG